MKEKINSYINGKWEPVKESPLMELYDPVMLIRWIELQNCQKQGNSISIFT